MSFKDLDRDVFSGAGTAGRVNLCGLYLIIPMLNEASAIECTLQSLQALREQGATIIVVDGGSSDNSVTVAQPLTDYVINADKGRARQMNAGAEYALLLGSEATASATTATSAIATATHSIPGTISDTRLHTTPHTPLQTSCGNPPTLRWLWFIHADTQLPRNVAHSFASVQVTPAAWGFCRVRLQGKHWLFRVIERCMYWRSCLTHVATGDQCLWFSRDSWNTLGGFADIPLMEDVEISKRARRLGSPNVLSRDPVLTSSRRWEEHGIFKTVILMWRLRWRYFCGAAPQSLADCYRQSR